MTRDYIKRLLDNAAKAHHDYEATLGKPDDDWSGWYADYMAAEIRRDVRLERSRAHSDMHQL